MDSKIASFRISDLTPIPVTDPDSISVKDDILTAFSKTVEEDVRTKPSYTDCWVLNPTEDSRIISTYRTRYCGVSIGFSMNGETEYAVSPLEYSYPDNMNHIVMEVIEEVRSRHRSEGGRIDRDSIMGMAR